VGDDQFVQNFFYWAFLRYPNGTELQYWDDILRAAYYQGQSSLVFSGRELGMTLFESAEYAARADRQGSSWQANHNYVYDLYKTYLMRDPDQGGWDFWTGVVASAGRENVRHAFDECGEFAGIVGAVTPNGAISGAVSSLSTARVWIWAWVCRTRQQCGPVRDRTSILIRIMGHQARVFALASPQCNGPTLTPGRAETSTC
jgi:hypothetical protein